MSQVQVETNSTPLLTRKNITQLVEDIFDETWANFKNPDPAHLYTYAMELKNRLEFKIALCNANRPSSDKIKTPKILEPRLAARLIDKLFHVRKLTPDINSNSADTSLIIYEPESGLYRIDNDYINEIIRTCDPCYSTNAKLQVIDQLKDIVRKTEVCKNPNLTAVANGIYNKTTKTLGPFSPDYVFLAKSKINYNPNASNVKIIMPDGLTWDLETWIADLFDRNQELTALAWEIIHALLWPLKNWGKSIWFLSEIGNNGKGTFLVLLKNLCGKYTSIQLSEMSSPYALTEIIDASAIITDENDCDVYIDKLANFKALVTGDSIQINRKYKDPITFAFHGIIIQCINSLPKIKDKTESVLRRLLIIPFNKCFTGQERKYIKSEYLYRQDVLEYALKRALEMDVAELSEPEPCQSALREYQKYNDPVIAFWDELESEFIWDLLPTDFLYSLFCKWFNINYPSGKIPSKNKFSRTLKNLLVQNNKWIFLEKPIRTKTLMDKFEPLLVEYDLTEYKNPNYKGNDPKKLFDFLKKDMYRGIMRNSAYVKN